MRGSKTTLLILNLKILKKTKKNLRCGGGVRGWMRFPWKSKKPAQAPAPAPAQIKKPVPVNTKPRGILSLKITENAIQSRINAQPIRIERTKTETKHEKDVLNKIKKKPNILTNSYTSLPQEDKWYKNRFKSIARKKKAAENNYANQVFRNTQYPNLSSQEKKKYEIGRFHEGLARQYVTNIAHLKEFSPSTNTTQIPSFHKSTIQEVLGEYHLKPSERQGFTNAAIEKVASKTQGVNLQTYSRDDLFKMLSQHAQK